MYLEGKIIKIFQCAIISANFSDSRLIKKRQMKGIKCICGCI